MKKFFSGAGVSIALIFIIFFTAFSNDQNAAVETLLKTKIDAVLDVLSRSDLAETEKREQVMEIINPVMNFALMAKLTLGKENWARLTPEERTRFVDLFVERLKDSYLNKISLYSSDQTVIYEKAIEASGKVHVPTRLKTKDSLIEIIYKFYSTQDQWQVYDVEIDGVSFIKSYRAQFDEVLKNGTVADLFAELSKTEKTGAPVVDADNPSQPRTPADEI